MERTCTSFSTAAKKHPVLVTVFISTGPDGGFHRRENVPANVTCSHSL